MNLDLMKAKGMVLHSFRYKQESMFAGELLEQPFFGFLDLSGVLVKTVLDVVHTMNHEAPEEGGQLTGQSHVGDEPSTTPLDPPVEAPQGGIYASSHGTGDHAEKTPGPVAVTPYTASSFAALSSTGGYP